MSRMNIIAEEVTDDVTSVISRALSGRGIAKHAFALTVLVAGVLSVIVGIGTGWTPMVVTGVLFLFAAVAGLAIPECNEFVAQSKARSAEENTEAVVDDISWEAAIERNYGVGLNLYEFLAKAGVEEFDVAVLENSPVQGFSIFHNKDLPGLCFMNAQEEEIMTEPGRPAVRFVIVADDDHLLKEMNVIIGGADYSVNLNKWVMADNRIGVKADSFDPFFVCGIEALEAIWYIAHGGDPARSDKFSYYGKMC